MTVMPYDSFDGLAAVVRDAQRKILLKGEDHSQSEPLLETLYKEKERREQEGARGESATFEGESRHKTVRSVSPSDTVDYLSRARGADAIIETIQRYKALKNLHHWQRKASRLHSSASRGSSRTRRSWRPSRGGCSSGVDRGGGAAHDQQSNDAESEQQERARLSDERQMSEIRALVRKEIEDEDKMFPDTPLDVRFENERVLPQPKFKLPHDDHSAVLPSIQLHRRTKTKRSLSVLQKRNRSSIISPKLAMMKLSTQVKQREALIEAEAAKIARRRNLAKERARGRRRSSVSTLVDIAVADVPPPSHDDPMRALHNDVIRRATEKIGEMSPFRTKHADILVFKALVDINSGCFKDAAKKLLRALHFEPKHFEALFHCGCTFARMHKYETAMEM